jgi:predicted anti-sigma-YlaC factor YlaD
MHAENHEDVSWSVVPGSVGTAGALVTPWAPRATPASDRARAEAIDALAPLLDKFKAKRPRSLRAPVDSAEYERARARFARRGRA